jgi:hypothetical protein
MRSLSFLPPKPKAFDFEGTPTAFSQHKEWRLPNMPTAKEFTIRLEDRPGTLGKVSRALADRGVNILAFQSISTEGKALTRIVVDTPVAAIKILDNERLTYTEAEVAQVKLPNRLGELARAASRLGEANININYAYCGLEAGTNAPLLVFGVAEVSRAVTILEQAASAAAAT